MFKRDGLDKVLFISGIALAGLLLVATILFEIAINTIDAELKGIAAIFLFPANKFLIGIILLLISLITAALQYWKIPGIVAKAVSLILSVVLLFGSIYALAFFDKTKKTIDKITYEDTDVLDVIMNVYVLKSSGVDSIDVLLDGKFGILEDADREQTDGTIADIENEFNTTLNIVEYDKIDSLVRALYTKEVDAIIMNKSYEGTFQNMEEFEHFIADTNVIANFQKNKHIEPSTQPEIEIPEEFANKDCVTFYISGIDINGSPTESRNSDVNIICVLNKTTEQAYLLNTPRDYYVPLTVSNGQFDKLTHAGCYGINCSVGTLEMLYGIHIDHYIKLNFSGFKSLVDSVGGVDVYSKYAFTSFHGGFTFHEGMNHMNGEEALGFARERYSFPDGDNQRGRNEMAVIEAIIKKLSSTVFLTNYSDILDSISECVATNMASDDIVAWINYQLKETPKWDVQQYSVTGACTILPCFSLSQPNDVMLQDENYVNQAKAFFNAIYNNNYIETP